MTATEWTNQRFNSSEARNWTSPSSPTLTPVGAIVGAVVGGLVVIVVFIIVVIWIIRRHRQRLASGGVLANGDSLCKISETTVDSGLGSLTSGTRLIQRSASGITQMHNNYTSSSSLPFFQFPQRTIVSPARRERWSSSRLTPYMLLPIHENPEKKQSNGECSLFGPPNAPSQTLPRRASHNPPAYSEFDPALPMSRHHGQESLDSYLSTPDTGSQGSVMRQTHTPANSGSSMGTMHTSVSTARTRIGAFSLQQGLDVPLV